MLIFIDPFTINDVEVQGKSITMEKSEIKAHQKQDRYRYVNLATRPKPI